MNDERTRVGIPSIVYLGKPVVAADALSLLSGVNFGSVVKVLAALEALQTFTGAGMHALTKFSDVPMERCDPLSVYDKARADATRTLCEDITDSSKYAKFDDILKLRGRFGFNVTIARRN